MRCLGNVKWMFAEFLRLAQNLNRDEVVAIIEDIVQLQHPLIHELDGQPQVMHTGLSIGEEVLLLLQYSPQGRATKDQLRKWIPKSTPSSINMAVLRLNDARQVRMTSDGEVAITPPGQKRVNQDILPNITNVDASAATKSRRAGAPRRKAGTGPKKTQSRVTATK